MRCVRVLLTLLWLAGLMACTTPPAPPTPPFMPTPQAEPTPALALSKTRIVIKHGGFTSDMGAIMPLITAFEAANPQIDIQFVDLNTVSAQFSAVLSTPEESRAYFRALASSADVLGLDAIAAGNTYGLLQDLRPFIEADSTFDRQDFIAGSLAYDDEGRIEQLPRVIDFPIMLYNQELWQAAGLPPPDPEMSLEEYVDHIAQLSHTDGGTITQYGLVEWYSTAALLYETLAAGLDPTAPIPADFRLDRPELELALTRTVERARRGEFYLTNPEESIQNGVQIWDRMSALASTGRAAIFARDLYDSTLSNARPIELGMLVAPPLPWQRYAMVHGFVMSAGTQHPDEAWQWMAFLSHQDIRGMFSDSFRYTHLLIPARQSVADRIGFWENLEPDQRAMLQGALARDARHSFRTGNPENEWFAELSPLIEPAVTGRATVRELLTHAQQRYADRLLERQLATPLPELPPIMVEPALPEAVVANGATRITFATTAFSAARVQQAVAHFNASQAEIYVDLQTVASVDGMRGMAASSDCFTWPAAPGPFDHEFLFDLRPILDADSSLQPEQFPRGLLSLFEHQGGLYGLPDEVIVPTLSINPTSLQAAGVAYPASEPSLDRFYALAAQLTSGSGATQQYGYGALDAMPDDLRFFMARFGVAPLIAANGTLQPAFTRPEVREALNYYLSLLRESSPHTRFLGYRTDPGLNPAGELADAGRVAFWFNQANTTARSAVGQPATLAPALFGGTPFREDELLLSGVYISASSQQVGPCWEWLKALTDQPDTLELVANTPFRMTARQAHSVDRSSAQQQFAQVIFERLDQDVAQQVADTPADSVPLYWFYQAIDQSLQGADLAAALEQAQATTEQWLACVQSGEAQAACSQLVDPDYVP